MAREKYKPLSNDERRSSKHRSRNKGRRSESEDNGSETELTRTDVTDSSYRSKKHDQKRSKDRKRSPERNERNKRSHRDRSESEDRYKRKLRRNPSVSDNDDRHRRGRDKNRSREDRNDDKKRKSDRHRGDSSRQEDSSRSPQRGKNRDAREKAKPNSKASRTNTRTSKQKDVSKSESFRETTRMVSIPSPSIQLKDQESSTSESDPKTAPARFSHAPQDSSDKQSKCPLCMQDFDCPILLPCAHSFCKNCITLLVEASDGLSFVCPICNVEMTLTGSEEELFCPNFVVLKQTEQEESFDDLVCSSCDDRDAEFICEECADVLCSECRDAHRVVKYTKDHHVTRMDGKSNYGHILKKRYFCTEHLNEQLTFYCKECEKSMCRECALRDHKGDSHNCVPISEAAKTGRESLKRTLFNFQSRIPKLQLALMDVKRVKKLLKKQVRIVTVEISESIKRLISALYEREKILRKEVDDIYASKSKKLDEQRNRLLVDLERFEVSKKLLQDMSDHDNDVELLQMTSTVKQSLRELEMSNQKDIDFDKDTLFVKSNEINIKKEIDKHGGMHRMDRSSSPEQTSSKGQQKRNMLRRESFLQSDLDRNQSVSHPKPLKPYRLNFERPFAPRSRSSVLALKAKANWLIVKSRLRDIISYGEATNRIGTRLLPRKPQSLPLARHQQLKAKKMKSKANWMLVRLRLREIVAYNKGREDERRLGGAEEVIIPRVERATAASPADSHLFRSSRSSSRQSSKPPSRSPSNRSSTRRRVQKVLQARFPVTMMDYKKLHDSGIAYRAKSNWLIMRSRLYDITEYGRAFGYLAPTRRMRFKPGKSVLRMRNLCAKVMRGRANWMLVASRIPDIAEYGRHKTLLKRQSLGSIRQKLVNNKTMAGQNKQEATSIRARANWILVKSRLSDIIWYGEIRRQSKSPNTFRKTISKLQKNSRESGKRNSTSSSSASSRRSSGNPKSLRARANWMKVKSKLPAIVWYGQLRKYDKQSAKRNVPKKPPKPRSRHWDTIETWVRNKDSREDMTQDRDFRASASKQKRSQSAEGFANLVATAGRESKAHHRGSTSTENLSKSRSLQALNNWDKLRNSQQRDDDVDGRARSRSRSRSKSNERDALKNWDKLQASEEQELEAYENWDKLSATPKQKSKRHDERAYNNWDQLMTTPTHQSKASIEKALRESGRSSQDLQKGQSRRGSRVSDAAEVLYAKVEKPKKPKKPRKNTWDIIPSPKPSTSKDYVYQNWDELIEGTPPTDMNRAKLNWMLVRLRLKDIVEYGERRRKSDTGSRRSSQSFVKAIMASTSKLSPGKGKQKAPGPKKLLDSMMPSKGGRGEDARILNLNVKNYKGELENLEMKLTSPDLSILSAHMAENADGTFTVFCCPNIESDFNIFVSLSGGKLFKNETKVLNFYGSFKGMGKREIDLACRTIGLLRWHLTPGLLVRKGSKIVPRNNKKL